MQKSYYNSIGSRRKKPSKFYFLKEKNLIMYFRISISLGLALELILHSYNLSNSSLECNLSSFETILSLI